MLGPVAYRRTDFGRAARGVEDADELAGLQIGRASRERRGRCARRRRAGRATCRRRFEQRCSVPTMLSMRPATVSSSSSSSTTTGRVGRWPASRAPRRGRSPALSLDGGVGAQRRASLRRRGFGAASRERASRDSARGWDRRQCDAVGRRRASRRARTPAPARARWRRSAQPDACRRRGRAGRARCRSARRRGVLVAGAGADRTLRLEARACRPGGREDRCSDDRRVGRVARRIVVFGVNVDDLRFRPAGGYQENDGEHQSEDTRIRSQRDPSATRRSGSRPSAAGISDGEPGPGRRRRGCAVADRLDVAVEPHQQQLDLDVRLLLLHQIAELGHHLGVDLGLFVRQLARSPCRRPA